MTDTRAIHMRLSDKLPRASRKLSVYADGYWEKVLTVKDTHNREALYKKFFEENPNLIDKRIQTSSLLTASEEVVRERGHKPYMMSTTTIPVTNENGDTMIVTGEWDFPKFSIEHIEMSGTDVTGAFRRTILWGKISSQAGEACAEREMENAQYLNELRREDEQ